MLRQTSSETQNYKDLENIISFVVGSGDSHIKDSDYKYIQESLFNYTSTQPIIDPLKNINSNEIKKFKKQIDNTMSRFDSMHIKNKKIMNKTIDGVAKQLEKSKKYLEDSYSEYNELKKEYQESENMFKAIQQKYDEKLKKINDEWIFLNKLYSALHSIKPRENNNIGNTIELPKSKSRKSAKSKSRKSAKLNYDRFYYEYNLSDIKSNHNPLYKFLNKVFGNDIPIKFRAMSFHGPNFKTEILPGYKNQLKEAVEASSNGVELIQNYLDSKGIKKNKRNSYGGTRKKKYSFF